MLSHKTSGEFFQEIFSDVGPFGCKLGYSKFRDLSSSGTLFASRKSFLSFLGTSLQSFQIGGLNQFSGAQRCERFDTKVNAHGEATMHNGVCLFNRERDVIAPSAVECDRDRLGDGRKFPTPTNLYFSDFCQVELVSLELESTLRELGGLSSVLPLEPRKAAPWTFALQSVEKSTKGCVKVANRLLHRDTGHLVHPRAFGSFLRLGQESACRRVTRIPSGINLSPRKRIVPRHSYASKRLSERATLLRRRVDAIGITKRRHWSAQGYTAPMAREQALDRGRHSVTKLLAHLVCVTKYRRKVLDSDGLATIESAMRRVASEMAFVIVELNGESDHLHLVIRYPPKLSISKVVNSLKGVSSRRYKEAGHRMPSKNALWSPSYFASSVGGAPIEVLRQYVQNQEAGLKAGVSDPGET